MTRLFVTLVAAIIAIVNFPTITRACTPPTTTLESWTGPMIVPSEGTVVWFVDVVDGQPAPLVTVRAADASEVAGTTELIALKDRAFTGYGNFMRPALLVWRAAAPLNPGDAYSAAVSVSASGRSGGFDATYELTAATEPRTEVTTVPTLEVTDVAWAHVADGPETCAPSEGGECDDCYFTDWLATARIEARLVDAAPDRFTLYRVVPDSGSPIVEDQAIWDSGDNEMLYAGDLLTGRLDFPDVDAAEHCFHVEAESLVDGSIVAGPSQCVPAPAGEPGPVPTRPDPDPDPAPMSASSGGCSAADGGSLPAPVAVIALLSFIAVTSRRGRR